MPSLLVRLRRPLVLVIHLALVPVGYYTAFALRFDFQPPPVYRALFWSTLPYLLVLRLVSFWIFGLFRGWWRHVGMSDLVELVKAVTAGSVGFLFVLFMGTGVQGAAVVLPRSVVVLEWGMALFLFGGIRFFVRAFREHRFLPWRSASGRRTLIIGAGTAAERLLRVSQRDGGSELCPLAIVDDDREKMGMRLHGVPVVGTTEDLPELVGKAGVELVVIAIPSATRAEMRSIVDACLRAGVDFKIVPSLRELLDGRARLGELRSVQIEDLLGREVINLSEGARPADLSERTVLVTGGAGSIGSELARQAAALAPRRLVLLDQAESPLYFHHLALVASHPELEIIPLVADITDQTRMESIFARYRPQVVFHAAAYKHVPLMEENAVEAVRNNVLGTLCVAQVAARYAAEKFVLISTDKAVHPSSVMGATKCVSEQIVLGWPTLRESRTDFRAVRFGNVLGSDGSVIPLFKRQLAAGQPLTVTHPDVTRYFMTIPEAVQLVLQAAALPEAGGRIAMLEMGDPVRIVELAENLVRLSGLEPYTDVPIVFTGLRPGEKLHEELMSETEATVPTTVAKIRIVQTEELPPSSLTSGLDRLGAAVAVGSQRDAVHALWELVPDRALRAVEPGS